jgi:hypothetical protein
VRRLVGRALVAAAAIASALILFTAAPARARDRIVGAALAQSSVHNARTVSQDMVGTYRSAVDVSANWGAARRGWFGGGTVLIRLINDTVYVRAMPVGSETHSTAGHRRRRGDMSGSGSRSGGVTFSSGDIGGELGRFGKWNEPVHVQASARSTPIATPRGA